MTRKLTVAVASLLLAASAAMAAENAMPAGSIDKARFETVKAHLIAQLDDEQYKEITEQDKKNVVAALDRISARLAKPQPMGDQDAVDTFNDQELINQITSHAAAESRMFCERDMPTGSHRIRVVCLTIGKWMERENEGQMAMRQVEINHRATCPSCNRP